MSVAENHNMRFLARDSLPQAIFEFVRLHNVMEQDFVSTQFNHLRKRVTKPGVVGVPAHRGYRRDLLQFGQEMRLANIAAVKDTFDAAKQVRDLRVEVIVGIGNDAELQGGVRSET